MPLVFCEVFAKTGLLALWETTESADELARAFRGSPADIEEVEGIAHPQKQLEFLASRALVRTLVENAGLGYQGLEKDSFGKPRLVRYDGHLSLTHTARFAAAVLHPTRAVGIDLEPVSDKLQRVVPRVLSPAEIAHAAADPQRLAIYWTAKEAIYKLYGRRGLSFRDHLFIEPFADGAGSVVGQLTFAGLKQSFLIEVRYGDGQVLAVGV
ncbi:MAG: 4'-phosphopantetheinyl transferase superfamily protein [Cytophagaceae bacterium]|nr:4'-phosphopantetheinyl transferase superfamily protein [Cytophagaceae bacterium]